MIFDQHLHFFFLSYALALLADLALRVIAPPSALPPMPPPIDEGMLSPSSYFLSIACSITLIKAWSTWMLSLALVSKWGIFPFFLHQASTSSLVTALSDSRSALLP